MRQVPLIHPTASYNAKVKIPGKAFLTAHPAPARDEFNRNDYWKEIHDEMYYAYQGICMYCASWTPRTPKGASLRQTSIDHFIPKSLYPQFAYDWSNFRLSRNDLNTNKGQDMYVPDPFSIHNDWFEIDFATWIVGPSTLAPEWVRHRIRSAFVRLGLNEDAYIEERQNIAAIYVHLPHERAQLTMLYPFLVAELTRQSHGTTLIKELLGLLPSPS